jgi:hypothetical protein
VALLIWGSSVLILLRALIASNRVVTMQAQSSDMSTRSRRYKPSGIPLRNETGDLESEAYLAVSRTGNLKVGLSLLYKHEQAVQSISFSLPLPRIRTT